MFKRSSLNTWQTKDAVWTIKHHKAFLNICDFYKKPAYFRLSGSRGVLRFPLLRIYSEIPEYQEIIDTIHNLYAGGNK